MADIDISESSPMSGPLHRDDSTATIDTDTSLLLSTCESDIVFPYTLELLESIDIKQGPNDKKKPRFGGIDFLPDGRLVAVDNSNCRCLIMDERLRRQGAPYTFQSKPVDVICVSANELAVTLLKQKICLLAVNTANKITLTKVINTSTQFYSICLVQSSMLAATTSNFRRSVRMISFTGKEADIDNVVFPMKAYTRGGSKCAYIQSKNTLVLTDRYAHTVYLYDTVKGTSKCITNESIKQPGAARVGPCDTVIFCSSLNKAIIHMKVDGEILGFYPIDLTYPCKLCMVSDGSRLAVTNRGDERVLRLYKCCKRESS